MVLEKEHMTSNILPNRFVKFNNRTFQNMSEKFWRHCKVQFSITNSGEQLKLLWLEIFMLTDLVVTSRTYFKLRYDLLHST